jgi:glycosyltransferase domain-containing protein
MHDLTLLLTLKNREQYTNNWLEKNIFPEFSYLIADGSDNSLNSEICLPYVAKNVTYLKCRPDLTYPIYMQKRRDAMSKISTRFVLSVDNDDFLLRPGLNKIMDMLKKSPHISLIQGNVGKVRVNEQNQYKRTADWKVFLGNHEGKLTSLQHCLSNYYSLWYSISEVNIQRKILDIFCSSGLESPYLAEEFQTFFSLAMAKTMIAPWYYYVRLENPVSSNDSVSSSKHMFDAVLDPSYYKSFSYLVAELGRHHSEVSERELYLLLRDYQISKLIHRPLKLSLQFRNALHRKWTSRVLPLLFPRPVYSADVTSLFPDT